MSSVFPCLCLDFLSWGSRIWVCFLLMGLWRRVISPIWECTISKLNIISWMERHRLFGHLFIWCFIILWLFRWLLWWLFIIRRIGTLLVLVLCSWWWLLLIIMRRLGSLEHLLLMLTFCGRRYLMIIFRRYSFWHFSGYFRMLKSLILNNLFIRFNGLIIFF